MLSSIYVNGFKSLSDFDLKIQPGLNVLIGPNGAGKTNILKFFEFLSELTDSPLAEAVSKLGGAGEIFKRKAEATFEDKISFAIKGEGDASRFDFRRPLSEGSVYIRYEVEADITLTKDLNALYFDRQIVRAHLSDKPIAIERNDLPWHFEFRFEMSSETKTDLVKFDDRILKRYLRFDKKQFIEFISEIQKNTSALREYLMIGAISQIASPLLKITTDISSGRAYNIQPEKVRQAEDIAQPPVINSNGSGFAATLFALKAPKTDDPNFWWFAPRSSRRRYPPDAFKRVQSYSQLINDSILGIDVVNDPLENKLKVVTKLRSADGDLEIPLSFLSDGTVKWLSLVTAVLTSQSIFAIEEPENFLHPRMQEEIVKIVRSVFTEKNAERFAIMTTHSETLLNSLSPEELIVTFMEQGQTIARRPKNAEEIVEEIRRTGFGLGFYYISGAIE